MLVLRVKPVLVPLLALLLQEPLLALRGRSPQGVSDEVLWRRDHQRHPQPKRPVDTTSELHLLSVSRNEDTELIRWQDDGIVAWVSFGRVGSASMQTVLATRAQRHAWKEYDGPGGLCHDKELNGGHDTTGCFNVEPRAVVQTEYGFCELLNGSRPCRYMTLLRAPIDHVVSQYNYFCKGCGGDGGQCVNETEIAQRKLDQLARPGLSPKLTCPNMSIVDYARHRRNQYTMQFSGKKRFCSRTGEVQDSQKFRDCSESLSEIDYEAALKVLKDPRNIVLRLETLWNGGIGGTSGMQLLGCFLHDDVLGQQEEVHNSSRNEWEWPSKEEVQTLREYLSYDVRLYDEMVKHEVTVRCSDFMAESPNVDGENHGEVVVNADTVFGSAVGSDAVLDNDTDNGTAASNVSDVPGTNQPDGENHSEVVVNADTVFGSAVGSDAVLDNDTDNGTAASNVSDVPETNQPHGENHSEVVVNADTALGYPVGSDTVLANDTGNGATASNVSGVPETNQPEEAQLDITLRRFGSL